MNIFVLGGTGSVGRLIVGRAVERGHRVTVLARDPTKVAGRHPALRVVQGDALQRSSVEHALAGHDAVISALGAGLVRRTTLFSESTRILLDLMQRHEVHRLITITGVGAGETRGHGGFFYNRVIYPLFNKGVYEDKDRQEALIRQADLEWTIVRPASFLNRRGATPIEAAVEVSGVNLCWISRDEVSVFVIDELEQHRFVRQAVFIGHRC